MCGRFTLRAAASTIAEQFALLESVEFQARFNIAPTQSVAVVRAAEPPPRRELVMLRWGLVPAWAKDPAIGNRLINARAETAAGKPAFRAAMGTRRCLVVADGFYEWQVQGKQKQPYYIHRRDGGVFGFGGLWERWQAAGQPPLESCTILTTNANPLLATIHDRMPVIIAPNDYERWLARGPLPPAELARLTAAWADDDLVAEPIGTHVNRPANEGPECIRPLA